MKLAISLGCFLTLACNAYGDTIADTFGTGGYFNVSVGWGDVLPAEIAFPFTVPVTSNYIFESASLALSEGIGSDNTVTVSLATNAAGVPGSVLESMSAVVEPYPDDTSPVLVTSAVNPTLTAGSIYWLIVYPAATGNGVNWLTGNVLTTPDLFATLSPATDTWSASPLLYTYNNPGAFSVSANAVSTPEGSSASIVLAGIALLVLRRTFARVRG